MVIHEDATVEKSRKFTKILFPFIAHAPPLLGRFMDGRWWLIAEEEIPLDSSTPVIIVLVNDMVSLLSTTLPSSYHP